MRQYIGLIHKDPGSDYGVSFPDLPGCVTAGLDLDDARRMAEDTLALHLAGMAEDEEADTGALLAGRRDGGSGEPRCSRHFRQGAAGNDQSSPGQHDHSRGRVGADRQVRRRVRLHAFRFFPACGKKRRYERLQPQRRMRRGLTKRKGAQGIADRRLRFATARPDKAFANRSPP